MVGKRIPSQAIPPTLSLGRDVASWRGEGVDSLPHAEELLEHFEALEKQFNQLRAGLTHSHRLTTLGTLTSVVAHEYNNILTPVISYAQMALASPDDGDLMRKAVEKALAGAERAAQISASLLGFAQEQGGQAAARLPDTVHDAIACLARDPHKDGIEIEIDLPEATVAMSALNLQQVLVNLILNAKKAMRGTGGRIRISAEDTGERWRLMVADDGPGIPEAIRDRLFEPFVTHSEDPAPGTPAQARGTGLGLCICRDLVRAAGGEITVDTATGAGTVFVIDLPKREERSGISDLRAG